MWSELSPKTDAPAQPAHTGVDKLVCPKPGCGMSYGTRDHLLRHLKKHGIIKGHPLYPKLQPSSCDPKVVELLEQQWGADEDMYDPRKLPEVNQEGNK